MRVKTWKILDAGGVTKWDTSIELECRCGNAARLPVVGRPIAQVGIGLIFDPGTHAIPKTIQCRTCGRVLERDQAKSSKVAA